MSSNALADFMAASKAGGGQKPGQSFPNMGKRPFAEPGDDAAREKAKRSTATPNQQGPQHAPLPPQMMAKPNAPPKPDPSRFSPKQGMRQIDGSQSMLGTRPQKDAPLQTRGATSPGAHESSFERAMGAAADKHHPMPKGRKK